jgi:hypothetical protein
LKFFVKSYKILKICPFLLGKKKLLGFRYWLEFGKISMPESLKKFIIFKKIKINMAILEISIEFNEKF